MLRDAAVDLLLQRLGQRTGQTSLRDKIIAELAFVQEVTLEGAPELPWFLLTESATTTTTIGEERVQLPGDFLQEWDDSALVRIQDDGSEKVLIRDDWDVVKYSVTGSGPPTHYDLVGDYYLLRPVPDKSYTLKMRYYARALPLSGTYGDANNIENLWLKWASDWLIAETGALIAEQYLQSPGMAARFKEDALRARARVMAKSTIMAETNKQRFMEG